MVLNPFGGNGQASFLDMLQECTPLRPRSSKEAAYSLRDRVEGAWTCMLWQRVYKGPPMCSLVLLGHGGAGNGAGRGPGAGSLHPFPSYSRSLGIQIQSGLPSCRKGYLPRQECWKKLSLNLLYIYAYGMWLYKAIEVTLDSRA